MGVRDSHAETAVIVHRRLLKRPFIDVDADGLSWRWEMIIKDSLAKLWLPESLLPLNVSVLCQVCFPQDP